MSEVCVSMWEWKLIFCWNKANCLSKKYEIFIINVNKNTKDDKHQVSFISIFHLFDIAISFFIDLKFSMVKKNNPFFFHSGGVFINLSLPGERRASKSRTFPISMYQKYFHHMFLHVVSTFRYRVNFHCSKVI